MVGYERLKQQNHLAWDELWRSRIKVIGCDEEDQQALDVAFYYLHSNIHPSTKTGYPPFGLTQNSAYYGHNFWDTDLWTFIPTVLVQPEAGKATTTGSTNVAVGYNAMIANTEGGANTAVGGYAGDAITTGNYNTAVGYGALSTATTTSNNTAVGSDALGALTSGTGDTAVGFAAGDAMTTGLHNTAIGNNALTSGESGYTVAVGSGAGYSHAAGDGCVMVGYNAGYAAAATTNSVFIGQAAGDSTTGSAVADVTMSMTSIQAAYSMGSMSIKAYRTKTNNPAYNSNGNSTQVNEIALGLSF